MALVAIVGLAFYAIWRVLTAFLPGDSTVEAVAMRAGYLIRAILYGSFAVTSLSQARHHNEVVDGNEKVRDVTSSVLDKPFGRGIIGVGGAIAIGAAPFRLLKAMRGDAADELKMYELSPKRRRWTQLLAIFGQVGPGVAVVLI